MIVLLVFCCPILTDAQNDTKELNRWEYASGVEEKIYPDDWDDQDRDDEMIDEDISSADSNMTLQDAEDGQDNGWWKWLLGIGGAVVMIVLFFVVSGKGEDIKDGIEEGCMKVGGCILAIIILGLAFFAVLGVGILFDQCGGSSKEYEETDSVLIESNDGAYQINQVSPDGIFMCLQGNIGGATFDMVMNGDDGWYNNTGSESVNSRRILEFVSFDSRDGHFVMNAYLRGEHVGRFDGYLEADWNVIPSPIISYEGIFHSSTGSRLNFLLK